MSHRVLVVTRADLRDLGQQTYLSDLLTFTTRRMLTSKADPTVPGPFVTAGQLAEAVAQDLPAVARMTAAEATASTPTLRLVIESLLRYIRPGPPAPLASWALREGRGTVAEDTASGLCDGQLVGTVWVPGADPPVLHFGGPTSG